MNIEILNQETTIDIYMEISRGNSLGSYHDFIQAKMSFFLFFYKTEQEGGIGSARGGQGVGTSGGESDRERG
jgi:hypothetical protein